ncbi:MAG: ferredoxin [Candidatus Izemoplasma sp.]
MNKFSVNESCINCKACVRVAPKVFVMEGNQAIVFNQPRNVNEQKNAQSALDVCPVGAITVVIDDSLEPIKSTDNIRKTIEKYPVLNYKLVKLNKKFERLYNPVMWNTVAKFATFKDAAKMTGLSVCEILHYVNLELGLEENLKSSFPNCITDSVEDKIDFGVNISWDVPNSFTEIDVSSKNDLEDIIALLKDLNSKETIDFHSNDISNPLIETIKSLGYLYNIGQINLKKYIISVYNDNNIDRRIKNKYEKLDVRLMKKDPFDIILKKAYGLNQGDGFILIQTFIPHPLINMLVELDYEYEIDNKKVDEVWVYFTKIASTFNENSDLDQARPSVTIQSATPVGYPIIMRLLQSKKMRKLVKIVDLKIWEETEKHLGWIVNKKADISFSAVITATKLASVDVKMPAVFVWDNFSILTKDTSAKAFADLKGKDIYLPLFEDAPPAKITKYLIESSNGNIKDYNFKYGEPFGRPNEMYRDFVDGKIDTVLLREPEASFAINNLNKMNIEYSEIPYGEVWNDINKGFGLFPNAGVVIKGEFVRKHPKIVEAISEELKEAINWVNSHKKEASDLAFDMMRAKSDDVELFLDRVTYKYVEGDELVSKVKEFYDILVESDIIQTEVNQELLDVFKI